MFNSNELQYLFSLTAEYEIIRANGHDICIKNRLTTHEWIVISPYDGSPDEILHRHSSGDPFHHQKGRYSSLIDALDYINEHDKWVLKKKGLKT